MCEEINKPGRKGAVRARKRLEITCTGEWGGGGEGARRSAKRGMGGCCFRLTFELRKDYLSL